LRPLLLLPALLALFAAAPAAAQPVKVGGTDVTLTAPNGQCALDPSKPQDVGMLRSTEALVANGGNRLLGLFVDCKQLADWRAGKRTSFEAFAQYQTLTSMENASPPPAPETTLKEICANMRTEGEKMAVGLAADMKARIEQVASDVKLNQVRFLGVAAEEPGVCYAVSVQRFKSGTRDVSQVALIATTFVKGKLVYYYLFAPYQTNFTVPSLLARHKPNVAAFLAANKG
jgi:hypothetical protein